MNELRLILGEIERRKQNREIKLLDPNFPQQTKFILSPFKRKVAWCTRRAAKSYAGGLYLIKECLENPGVTCLYIALTRQTAKAIMWKDILKDINRRHKLEINFNETLLTATLPNGSIIYLMGVDTDEEEKKKLLGQKYKLAVIDEGEAFTIDLAELIYGILGPAVADYRGTILLMGTAGNLTKGLFYDVTTRKEPGWEIHEWTAYDNPYVRQQWEEEIQDIKINRPLFMETPLFKQWYLNQWVVDDEALVYKFSRDRNLYKTLPIYTKGEWNFVLGVDLGYEDDTAFVVSAHHPNDRCLYFVKVIKKKKMDITAVAQQIRALQLTYNCFKVVIDGSNKQAVEEMRIRHQIPLIAADKTGKSDFIELMNGEFIQGYIKLHETESKDLWDEYLGLIWNDKSKKKEEHPNCANHACDGALYNWRHCKQYFPEPIKLEHKIGTTEWGKEQETEMERAAKEHFENLEQQDADWL